MCIRDRVSAIASGLLLAFALPGSFTGLLASVALIPLLRILLNGNLTLPQAVCLGWLCGLIAYGIHFSYVVITLNGLVFSLALAYVAFYTGIFSAGVVFSRRNLEWGCLVGTQQVV